MKGNLDGVNNDYIAGWAYDPTHTSRRVKVDVLYNGRHLTTATAGLEREGLAAHGIGDGQHGFVIPLPALSAPESAEIVVVESSTRTQIGKSSFHRRPNVTAEGISSVDVQSLLTTPLFSLEGFDLKINDPTLNLYGFHLPPNGDPFSLQIKGQPGVVFKVQYPLLRSDITDYFWFWPNAAWCGFKISIDLVASTHRGPDFQFTFESPSTSGDRKSFNLNRIWMPKDLSALQNFPTGDQLTRVHNFDTSARVSITGYTDFRRFQSLAALYGMDLKDRAILDWGCGHGRVIRFFEEHNAVREAWGCDIDKENIDWLRSHLPGVKARVAPLMPKTDLPAGHFDMIYAISVMTHLRRDVQEAWLKELKRISKPGALIMLTFAGAGAAAFSSRHLTKKWLDTWKRTGFDETLGSPDLIGKIEDADYYINTTQTADDVRKFWGKHFEILGIHECSFGYQDLAVMRVPQAKTRVAVKTPAKKISKAKRAKNSKAVKPVKAVKAVKKVSAVRKNKR